LHASLLLNMNASINFNTVFLNHLFTCVTVSLIYIIYLSDIL
jgi:hypothetical protein